jgi:tryptophan 2,3-dioxygenase
VAMDQPFQDQPGAEAVLSASAATPIHNDRGVIAESYHDLQGLGVLAAARACFPLPHASAASTLRAIFQAAEVALLNLEDLLGRAAADVKAGALGRAVVKMAWARGFHRVLTRLSLIPQQLALALDEDDERTVLRIEDSPAFADYLRALRSFDDVMLRRADSGDLDVETAIADESLDNALFSLVHVARVANHESTIWERNLAAVPVPAVASSYHALVVPDVIKQAVYDRVLTGDTYFTQFRGLHQIPEILGEEVNDRLEQGVGDLRAGRWRKAADHLRRLNILAEGMFACLPPIVDNLATSDYHQIRENLGLTSGSHSVCLRYHMFTHLYEQWAEELQRSICARSPRTAQSDAIEDGVRRLARDSQRDTDAWILDLLIDEALKFRAFVFQWREEHLNLPRNNLGGEFTKSLTGSADAVQAVIHMRDTARARDALLPAARARGVAATADEHRGELSRYLESNQSLDTWMLRTTGRITKDRFHDVQERLGFFATRCPFSPPARRRA